MEQRFGLPQEGSGLCISCPAGLPQRLPQTGQGGPGLLLLAELVARQGLKRQVRRGALVESVGPRQCGRGRLVLAGAVLSHAQGGYVPALIGGQTAGRVRLAEGQAIRKSVEVALADDGPTSLVKRLRIGFLAIMGSVLGLRCRRFARRWLKGEQFASAN